MLRFLVHWITVAIALGVASYVVPGVRVETPMALAVAALVLGLVNACVRPVLQVLALPFTVLTLGIFYFVVNGIAFALAAWLVPGFEVTSLVRAVLGALVVSIVSWFVGLFMREEPAA